MKIRLNLTIDSDMDPMLSQALEKVPKRLRTERIKKLALIGLAAEHGSIHGASPMPVDRKQALTHEPVKEEKKEEKSWAQDSLKAELLRNFMG